MLIKGIKESTTIDSTILLFSPANFLLYQYCAAREAGEASTTSTSKTTSFITLEQPSSSLFPDMCSIEWVTGSACVYREGRQDNGTPKPLPEGEFEKHGVWVFIEEGCTKFQKTGQHCSVTIPSYEEIVKNIGFTLLDPDIFKGTKKVDEDHRCPKCRGIDAKTYKRKTWEAKAQ